MTKIFAHRGLSHKYPENSLKAFKKAYDNNMDGIELDVHMTRDGEIVVNHDFYLDRTTNGSGLISNYTYKELKSFYLRNKGETTDEKIPTLIEVFDIFKDKDFEINIEVKAGYRVYKNIEEKLLKYINEYYCKKNIIVSSFDHYSLVKVKNIDSDIKTGALIEASLYKPWNYLKSISVDFYHPNYITLTDELIEESDKNNIKINTYTVDNSEVIKNLIDKNINIIITNKLYKIELNN